MRHLILLPVLTLTLTAGEALSERVHKIQRLSLDGLRQLQGELALSDATPDAKAYHEANLAYSLAARRTAKDPKADLALLDRAISILEPRLDAESKALLGACLGVKIGFSPMSGMSLAPKAMALFDAALKQSPGNPRVLTFQGLHLLNTPKFFGGGPEAALPILEAAVKAAESEKAPANAWAPAWGRAESLVWLAQAQRRSGQEELAKASLQRALEVDPNYANAQVLLKGGK